MPHTTKTSEFLQMVYAKGQHDSMGGEYGEPDLSVDEARQALADHLLGLPSLQDELVDIKDYGSPKHKAIVMKNRAKREARQEIAQAFVSDKINSSRSQE